MSKRKKIFVLLSMVLVLGVAAYLNIVLLNDTGEDDLETTGSFFQSVRYERHETRVQEMNYLESVIAMEGDEYEQARVNAVAQKLKLIEIMEMEALLESLLKAKGFEEVVVSIGMNSDNINVIVKSQSLTREDTAVIYSTIVEETQAEPELVKILPIK